MQQCENVTMRKSEDAITAFCVFTFLYFEWQNAKILQIYDLYFRLMLYFGIFTFSHFEAKKRKYHMA
jgi:hypothetical protein